MKGSKVKYIRFPVLFIVLATIALTCSIYVSIHGSTYTAEQINHIFNKYEDIELSAKSNDENILAVEKVYFNDNHLICVDVHSVNPGDTKVTVMTHYKNTANDNSDYRIVIPFHVNFLGTVFQTDTLNFDGFLIIQYCILVGLFLVLLVTGYTFVESFFKARFSYLTVACGGMALFSLFLIVISLYNMQWMNTIRNFLLNISYSGFYFALLTTPFMLLLAGAIAFSNIWRWA